MIFTLSLAQIHIKTGQPEANLACAADMILNAARQGSQMVLLPELWSCGYDLPHAAHYAAASPNILNELTRLAQENHLCVGGSLLEAAPEGLYNTFTWMDPTLPHPLKYQKTHLFRLMEEDRWLQPGRNLQQVQAPWGPAGLSICYDLRFPEFFRRYALQGAQSFILSSEWPVRRISHWQVLLRARAIENQAFMIATNCVGLGLNDTFGGRSAVISPWGDVLIEGSGTEEDLLTTQIDTDQIEKARSFMPVFSDRQPDLY